MFWFHVLSLGQKILIHFQLQLNPVNNARNKATLLWSFSFARSLTFKSILHASFPFILLLINSYQSFKQAWAYIYIFHICWASLIDTNIYIIMHKFNIPVVMSVLILFSLSFFLSFVSYFLITKIQSNFIVTTCIDCTIAFFVNTFAKNSRSG